MLLSLLAVTAAAFPAPIPGETYHGPAPKGSNVPVVLRVAKGGRRVEDLTFGYVRRCRGASPYLASWGIRNLKVRDRRFSFRFAERNMRVVDRISVSGRFSADGTAVSGVFRWRVYRRKRVLCDTGRVRLRAAVPERWLVLGDWAGTTAQGRPVRFSINREGVTAASAEIVLTCHDGQQVVRALGSFPTPSLMTFAPEVELSLHSQEGSTVVDVFGTARRDLVSGHVSASDTVRRPDGTDVRCSSDPVPFEARRP